MMRTCFKEQISRKTAYFLNLFLVALFFLINQTLCYADVVLHGNQIITSPTSYNNVTLDLSDARFTVNTGGSLDIENSVINITTSASNPYFVQLNSGNLTLKNNTVNVTVSGLTQNPNSKSLYQLMQIQQGTVNINANNFNIDTPYTVGLFDTSGSMVITSGFQILNNTITNFHGGFYLVNSNNAEVDNNIFSNVSFSNIYNMGALSNFNGNLFSFPGNLKLGNAFDIINSDGINIANNIISSASNYGIFVMGGQNIFIDNNKITDGLSYGIYIQSPSMLEVNKSTYLTQLLNKKKMKFATTNNNIVISNNYLAQNRYGLSGGVVNQLIVTNNTFIQRFSDMSIRQYWTNNDILLPSVTNLTWLNNWYKEAFTQDISGDNSSSLKFVTFPAHGGVSLA